MVIRNKINTKQVLVLIHLLVQVLQILILVQVLDTKLERIRKKIQIDIEVKTLHLQIEIIEIHSQVLMFLILLKG